MINIAQGQDAIFENVRELIALIKQTQMAQLVREAA
jgi:hypothetical protein